MYRGLRPQTPVLQVSEVLGGLSGGKAIKIRRAKVRSRSREAPTPHRCRFPRSAGREGMLEPIPTNGVEPPQVRPIPVRSVVLCGFGSRSHGVLDVLELWFAGATRSS